MNRIKLVGLLVILNTWFFSGGEEIWTVGNHPTFMQILEDSPKGTVLVTLKANNDVKNITTDDSLVSVNRTGSGQTYNVILEKQLDRETQHIHELTFTVVKTNGEAPDSFRLYVDDVNDNAPAFQNIPYFWEINETPGDIMTPCYQNCSTFQANATDIDKGVNGTVRYFMQPVTQSTERAEEYNQTFNIDYTTGLVTLVKTVDYERNNYYQFTVFAKDLGTPSLTSNTSLVIQIKDVQDKPPFYTGIPYRATIDENIPKGSSILTVNAQDGDPGISNNVNYTIENGECDAFFTINPDSGEITTNQSVDRDAGPIKGVSGVCTLTVLTQEIEGDYEQYGNSSDVTNVTVIVTDLDDNIPKFNRPNYTATVQENAPEDIPITIVSGNIIVYDNDTGENAHFTLTLKYSDDSDCHDFEPWPDSVEGEQTVMIRVTNPAILDYEMIHNLTFKLIAVETINKTVSTEVEIFLKLLDVNDNNPEFPNSSYIVFLPENSQNFTSVINITATDRDSHDNLTYSLYGAGEIFIVNNKTGEIFILCSDCNNTFDREKRDVFFLTYVVTDQGGRSDTVPVEIHLLDINDNPPRFDRNYSASILENDNQYLDKPIVTFVARDNDMEHTDNSHVTYTINSISQDVLEGNITLNNTTGDLFLTFPIDFEALDESQVVIVVNATDNGIPELSSSTSVVIDVQDENDNTPEFLGIPFHGNIAENQTSNATDYAFVGQVNATDKDGTPPNNQFNYFISHGADEKFSISSEGGEVFVQMNAKLDRETKANYTLTILIIDRGASPKSATTTMEILIDDINDENPRFAEEQFNAEVTENSPLSSNVVHCFATDSDLNSFLQYNITSVKGYDENGNLVNQSKIENYFMINNATGEILVNGDIDRETVKTVHLSILVIDMNSSIVTSPQIDTANVEIVIEDVNDNDPVFVNDALVLNKSENAQTPYILETIKATDPDENRTINFSIAYFYRTNETVNPFSIDRSGGVLKLIHPIDREVDDVIIVTIQVTDSGVPSRSSFTNVTINVIDFNDNAPKFNKSSYETLYEVPEDTIEGTLIFNISASDLDKGPNAKISYFIDSGGKGNFTIDPIQGTVTVKNSLDREHIPSYILSIIAKDNPVDQSEQKSTSVSVTILITDINDNHPLFTEKIYNVAKREDTEVEKTLLTVTATDNDQQNSNNSRIFYTIDSMNTSEILFRINRSSGEIIVNMSLRDRVGVYELYVKAHDWGVPSLNNTVKVLITVEDVNLHDPVVTAIPSNHTIKIYECARINTVIHTFNHTDKDRGKNAEAYYNISALDITAAPLIKSTFNISEDGELYTLASLDVNNHSNYRMQLQAIDRGDPVRRSDKVTVTVDVLDVNNHPPEFTKSHQNYKLDENQNDTEFGQVMAVDEDTNAIKCYHILENEAKRLFSVEENNGILCNKEMLDYEANHSFNFTIKVHDCSIEQNISQVCDNIQMKTEINDELNVHVTIKDLNDNSPVFKEKTMFTGMVRRTEVNTTLQFKLKSYNFIDDKDTKQNGIESWVFHNDGPVIPSLRLEINGESGQDLCADGQKHVFCVGPNGTIINNKYFKEDISGYFIVPVKVMDTAGFDTANVTIYLIADTQILVMTILDSKEKVAPIRVDLLSAYSDIIGYDLVYDKIEDHKSPSGDINSEQSDLHFHIVDRETKEVLSGAEATRILDTFSAKLTSTMKKYHVTTVDQSVQIAAMEDNSSKTKFIMIGVIVALVVSNSIFIYVFFRVKNKYKRKLLAATITTQDKGIEMQSTSMAVPGSNKYVSQSNPLLNADIDEKNGPQYDEMSLNSNNSLDTNDIDYERAEPSYYDRLEDREVTLDMFTEDFTVPGEAENPLEAALRLHEQRKERNAIKELNENMEIDEHDGTTPHTAPHTFINDAYDTYDEQLESSEI